MHSGSHSTRGFTLVELLLVAGVLTLLAGVLLPQIRENGRATRDMRRSQDLRSVQVALMKYKAQYGHYPATGDRWIGDAENYGHLGYDAGGYVPGLVPDFLPSLPRDPDPAYPGRVAGYMYRSNGRDYKFVIHATPESFPAGNPYRDPVRPFSWMVGTKGALAW